MYVRRESFAFGVCITCYRVYDQILASYSEVPKGGSDCHGINTASYAWIVTRQLYPQLPGHQNASRKHIPSMQDIAAHVCPSMAALRNVPTCNTLHCYANRKSRGLRKASSALHSRRLSNPHTCRIPLQPPPASSTRSVAP